MIARMWRGRTTLTDAAAYVDYLRETGLKDYLKTPGNKGAYLLRRTVDSEVEFITLSFWESEEAIARFAGEDIGRAVFYPEDERYLVDRDLTVSHFEVVT